MAHGAYNNLVRRTASDEVLRDKAFEVASNPKYGRYQSKLGWMEIEFFWSKGSGIKSKFVAALNQKLADELQITILK